MKSYLLFHLLIFSAGSIDLAQAASCTDRYSEVNVDTRVASLPVEPGSGFLKGVKIRRVQPGGTGLLSTKAIGGDSDMFVGFLNGHPYVVAGEQRFDGASFFQATKTNPRPFLHEGVVVRIRDKVLKDKIEKYLEKQKPMHELNCVVGACKVLRQGGDAKFKRGSVSFYTPHNLLRALATKPIKSSSGGQAPVEVFVVGGGSVEQQISLMKEVSLKEGASLAQMVAGTLVVAGGIGYASSQLLP